ncbi:hypothetical protein ACXYMX_00550 [Sporosarcina sp. CAU 1771]
MKSKLEELFDNDETLGADSVSLDNWIMINDYGDAIDYVILEYADRWDVYLSLYDEGEAPYRNILVQGSSKDMDTAREIATRKLNEEYKKHVH